MKKILILLLSISLFTACSDDDDTSQNNEDKILGTWFIVEANNIPGYTVNECTGQSNITFNENNTANSEFFGTVEGECVSETDTGNWSSSGDSKFTFEVPQFGEVTGTVTFISDSRFRFTPDDLPASNLVFEK